MGWSSDEHQNCRTEVAFRAGARGVICFLIWSLACTGCMRKMPLANRAFSLEGTAEFPIMVPSDSQGTADNDYNEYQLELAGTEASTNSVHAANCTVKGTLFSLAPAKVPNSRLWIITSLNVQGWQRHSDSIDLQSEWMGFAREVLDLQRSGCFQKDKSPQDILRQISEAIPLPASEELLYSYSFGRSGFVDLVPGMLLVIERASFQDKAGTRVPASGANEFSERLAVVRRSPSGSALHLLGIASRGLGKNLDNGMDSLRSVPDRFAASSLLRLTVLTLLNDDTRRFPVLLGSTETPEIWEASERVVSGKLTGCPPSRSVALECMFLDKDSAVSVLISVWVNGRHLYLPLSTTVGSQIGRLPESEVNRALATVTLERPLIGGGYARVTFPHSLEGASKVILLNGDRLTWHH